MDLVLERLTSDKDSSIGVLFIDGRFVCFICEDERRAVKVARETRLPAGTFPIALRAEGGMHAEYTERFGAEWHRGMLWIRDVPDFEYAYLHIGNDDDDTEGCPLTGLSVLVNDHGGGTVGGSTRAYRKLYPVVRDALLRGEIVTLQIVDRDR